MTMNDVGDIGAIELPDKDGDASADAGASSSKWGMVKKEAGNTSKKLSVQERMMELRRRKQERVMEKKEQQVAAGMIITDSGAVVAPVKPKEVVFPEYTTVDRWEEYFAGLADDCVDGVQLSSAEEAMLRVHRCAVV